MVMVVRKPVDKFPELLHHGIKGQRWGKKNGPPYPLDYDQHSSAEKKQNSRLTIDGDADTGKKRKGLTDEQKALAKKILKGVAITAGVAAVAAVSYKAIESGAFDDIIGGGRGFVSKTISNVADKSQIGKSFNQIDKQMVDSINSDVAGTYEGEINCFHTTTSYILNSLFGKSTKALGFNAIDEVSGLSREGRDIKLYKAIFDNIEIESKEGKSFNEVFSELKPGSTGVLRIGNPSGHFINYEKDTAGNTTIVDPQNRMFKVMKADKWSDMARTYGYSPKEAIDFSNASIKENADEILKHIVKS